LEPLIPLKKENLFLSYFALLYFFSFFLLIFFFYRKWFSMFDNLLFIVRKLAAESKLNPNLLNAKLGFLQKKDYT
jgi:hypothetical protein